jgi:hypothetical protein
MSTSKGRLAQINVSKRSDMSTSKGQLAQINVSKRSDMSIKALI